MNFSNIIERFKDLIGVQFVLTKEWNKLPHTKGWRYGMGNALAVLKPGKLTQIWKILEICVESDLIVIMQAANTGLTGGSTPFGSDYDRPIVIINTMRIKDIHIIKEGSQIVGLTGSTLYGLEKIKTLWKRTPFYYWIYFNWSFNNGGIS